LPWTPLIAAVMDLSVRSTPEVEELDPGFRTRRLHSVVDALLGHVLNAPTVLLFEDAFWMDDSSSGLLADLAESVTSRPWLIVATGRPNEGTGRGGFRPHSSTPSLTLVLEPLRPRDSRRLLNEMAVLSDHQSESLSARAGGNPLFLRELMATAQ